MADKSESKVFIAVETLKSKTSRILLQVGCVSWSGELVHIPFSPTESIMARSRDFLHNQLNYRDIHRTATSIEAKFSKEDDVLTETLSQTVGMLQLLEFLQHSAAKSNITLVFYSIIEHQTLMMLAKNQFLEIGGESTSFLDAMCRVVKSTVIYEQHLQNSGGVLEPLYQLLDVKEKVYSAHKLALMLQELFGQEKLKLEDMQTVPLSQKIKKSIKVEEEKFLLLSSCKISTAPTAAFSDTCSKPYSISLQEEIRIGIKKLVFMSVEGVSTVAESQIFQIGCSTLTGQKFTFKLSLGCDLQEAMLVFHRRSPILPLEDILNLGLAGNQNFLYDLPDKFMFLHGYPLMAAFFNRIKETQDQLIILVFYSNVEYRAFTSLNRASSKITDLIHSAIVVETSCPKLSPLTIDESSSAFWKSSPNRAYKIAKSLQTMFEQKFMKAEGWCELVEIPFKLSFNHRLFRETCFEKKKISTYYFSAPYCFSSEIPEIHGPEKTEISFEKSNQRLKAGDPNVGICVHRTGLFGFNQPVLVDLGPIGPDVKSISYEANLEEYYGAGHAEVMRGSKNFAFVILRPRNTQVTEIQNYNDIEASGSILELNTPLILYTPVKETVDEAKKSLRDRLSEKEFKLKYKMTPSQPMALPTCYYAYVNITDSHHQIPPPCGVPVLLKTTLGYSATRLTSEDVFKFRYSGPPPYQAFLNSYVTVVKDGSSQARIVFGGKLNVINLFKNKRCGRLDPVSSVKQVELNNDKVQEEELSRLKNLKVVVGYHPYQNTLPEEINGKEGTVEPSLNKMPAAGEELTKRDAHLYPHTFNVSITLSNFIQKYKYLEINERLIGVEVRVAGTIESIRGRKNNFFNLRAEGRTLQVIATPSEYVSEERFLADVSRLRNGDSIGVIGFPGRAKRTLINMEGKLSIISKEIILLTASHLAPSGWTFGKTKPCEVTNEESGKLQEDMTAHPDTHSMGIGVQISSRPGEPPMLSKDLGYEYPAEYFPPTEPHVMEDCSQVHPVSEVSFNFPTASEDDFCFPTADPPFKDEASARSEGFNFLSNTDNTGRTDSALSTQDGIIESALSKLKRKRKLKDLNGHVP